MTKKMYGRRLVFWLCLDFLLCSLLLPSSLPLLLLFAFSFFDNTISKVQKSKRRRLRAQISLATRRTTSITHHCQPSQVILFVRFIHHKNKAMIRVEINVQKEDQPGRLMSTSRTTNVYKQDDQRLQAGRPTTWKDDQRPEAGRSMS